MDLNGNAITVSNEVWELMKAQLPTDAQGKPVHPITADALKPALEKFKAAGKSFKMAMVFPVSTHNYELRYWLAAGGIHPGFYSPSDVTGQIARRRADLGDAAAADAGDARSRHHQRLLRRRALEPAGHLQGCRRAGHHRLRNLEEQSGEGVRRHQGLGGEESATRTSRWSRR